jgi:hypothetical protein
MFLRLSPNIPGTKLHQQKPISDITLSPFQWWPRQGARVPKSS